MASYMTTHEIEIQVHFGPSAADLRRQKFSADTLISDLITFCKRDFRLPEQRAGMMIRYGFYRKQGADRVKLDPNLSLRFLRIAPHEDLYLADEGRLWWQATGPVTAPLLPRDQSEAGPPPPPPPPPPVSACSVELAPGCVIQVPEAGLKINRDYLIQHLPMSVSARERALVLIGATSRLEAVSRDLEGHCVLVYRQHWYLIANHTIYIGSSKYSHGEALPLEQTITILLGRAGWPITIRLHSTLITRYVLPQGLK